jgi:hypothetical protein
MSKNIPFLTFKLLKRNRFKTHLGQAISSAFPYYLLSFEFHWYHTREKLATKDDAAIFHNSANIIYFFSAVLQQLRLVFNSSILTCILS